MMHSNGNLSTGRIAGLPFHPRLTPYPVACLTAALLTDVAYWRTAEMMWADFSAWLISAGVILGWLAAITGLVDLYGRRYGWTLSRASTWSYVIANLVVLFLATPNMLVHTRDAWTSVVPWGIALSAATVVALLCTTWMGWTALYSRRERGVVA